MSSQFNEFDFKFLKKYKNIDEDSIEKLKNKDEKTLEGKEFFIVKNPNVVNNKSIESYNLIKNDKTFTTKQTNLNMKIDKILKEDKEKIHSLNNTEKWIPKNENIKKYENIQKYENRNENIENNFEIDIKENKLMNRFNVNNNNKYENKKSCFYCLGDHLKKDCPSNDLCFMCGKSGHKKERCNNKYKRMCRRCKRYGHDINDCNFLILEEFYYNDKYYNDLKKIICLNCNELGHLNCYNYENKNNNQKNKKFINKRKIKKYYKN